MNTSIKQSNEMIPSLTSFRFITALFVFLFHCKIHFGWTIGVSILDKFILNGAVFMTGFFVLSGFLMAHNYGTYDFSKRENIVYFSIFLHRFSIKDIIRMSFNDLTLVQGFFPTMFNMGINGGSWSLTVEIFLYFLFPYIILLIGTQTFKPDFISCDNSWNFMFYNKLEFVSSKRGRLHICKSYL